MKIKIFGSRYSQKYNLYRLFKQILNNLSKNKPSKMSASIESIFTKGVNTLLRNEILPAICSYIKEQKGVEVTPDELAECVGAPMSAIKMPNFPGTNVVTTTSAAAASARKVRAPRDPNRPKCVFTLTKGKNVGAPCGKACEALSDDQGNFSGYATMCTSHNKTGVKKATSAAPKMSGPQLPGAVQNHVIEAPKVQRTLNAAPFVTHDGRFLAYDKDTNIVIDHTATTSMKPALGMYEATGEKVTHEGKERFLGTIRPFTAEEAAVATSMGLLVTTEISSNGIVPTSAVSSKQEQTQSPIFTPKLPSKAIAPQMPQMPTMSQTPQMPQMPTMPQTPQMPTPTIQTPQMPTMPQQPQMPTIPQIPTMPTMSQTPQTVQQ